MPAPEFGLPKSGAVSTPVLAPGKEKDLPVLSDVTTSSTVNRFRQSRPAWAPKKKRLRYEDIWGEGRQDTIQSRFSGASTLYRIY